MTRPVRKMETLLFLAMINAGCAQMSGTYLPAESASPAQWPIPSIDNVAAPLPPEPTYVPQIPVVADAEPVAPQATSEPARRAAPPRRAATAPRAPARAVAAAPQDIWQRVRSGYQMNGNNNPLIADWERYYSSRPDYFAKMIENASHFMYHVTTEVERRGMPMEVALLPMIESAFNPVAYSSAHASGIWQFIPSTGKSYGLKQNAWYDGRRDVIAATSAALDYLQTLYRMFNDWEHALAAYNWGEGAVQRAIERNQARGLPTDYQSLYPGMPAETRNYVPKLLAVKNIIEHPARFGLALAHVPNEPYLETVTIRRHIDITLAARFAGMSIEEFRFLNPAHNKPVINSDSAETIVLPRHRVAMFNNNIAQYANRPLVSTKTHLVRAGERPESIAELYGISVAELNNMNNIGGRRRIATGQALVVPNRDDLQPVLAELPVPTTVFAAAARPVYTRQSVARRVVVIRNGQRRTVVMAAPVQRISNRMPLRQTLAAKPVKRKVVYAAPKAAVKIRNR